MQNIYILLPVHNRKTITLKFIDSLILQNFTNYHLILIDDGSDDGTDIAVRQKVANLTILRGNGNLWWAGALQKGIDYLKNINIAGNDIILFINDDTYMPTEFIKIGAETISRRENIIVKATLYSMINKQLINTGFNYIPDKLEFKPTNKYSKSNIANTNGLFIKWEDLLRIGDFKPKLLPHYLSDYEFTYRANQMGYCIFVEPSLMLYSNTETSGYRNYKGDSKKQFIKTYFTKKSVKNPLYWSIFIVLTSNRNNWIKLISRVWMSSIKDITQKTLYS